MDKLQIDNLLYNVERPARYLGNELNSVHKIVDENMIRFAFCFPDVYEVGMSHLGMQILYNLLNKQESIFCERVFTPAIDMEEEMNKNNIPLFALESRQPIRNFDFVGFTLQYELSYTNILSMLKLAGIPIYSGDRKDEDPIIIVGGPCVYNCEPIADFIDIAVLGEAEEVILEITDLYNKFKNGNYNRLEFLKQAALIEGVYIPSLYDVNYNEDGTINGVTPKFDGIPKTIRKRVIKNLDDVFYPEEIIVPYLNIVHDRIMMEIFRGCIRGCRFCQAGIIYRPVREKSFDRLQEITKNLVSSTGYDEISLASLSTSDYSQLEDLVRHLIDEYGSKKIGISLPSLRLDNFSLQLIEEIQKVRKTGLTFAPEAGSQRLRDVINKGITEEDLINATENAFSSGWSSVKLYFMIGLPTETDTDIIGIKDLAFKVVDAYYKTPKEQRGKGLNVTVSASTFVPKPFTPFQWEPQSTLDAIYAKQKLLVSELKHKNITFNYHDSKTSLLEAVFAKGDRRLSKVLEIALEEGCKFDGWIEHFNFDKWMAIFDKANIDPSFYANRRREYDEVLPWDHIDVGVSKQFLIRESENAKNEKVTANCRTSCAGCGVNQIFTGGIC
ncbi:TIGR03960 family B12-binding radical SAM protein [Alkaliphilus sp. MSJ-5]|uniref:TIGR03960 family B12-binding radical SAM protein n=1 Tax=Alkaliphilus flagellatus TaxID=2841507 RepID=A0ABS6G5E2_9FIRM|nr:TIGR03960 family B12-binding radical SAM protein [Alkaliphilus flagellatus]MBU5677710.1 TIGR03960 family B12-binding radical SAM protein [Alkaliphilus flagellatus]